MKKKATFLYLLTAALVALILIVGWNIPQIVAKIWKYCLNDDKGYMWVVNLLIGAVVTFVIVKLLKKGGILTNLIAIMAFILSVIISECAMWHRSDMVELFRMRYSSDTVTGIAIGIIASFIAFLMYIRTVEYDE